jgi:hypothetical protein
MPTTTTPYNGRASGTYTYDPTTHTGHDAGTGTTQVAPSTGTSATTTSSASTSAPAAVPASQGSGIG